MNTLFRKYTDGFTVGELSPLPKSVTVDASDDRMTELGYVRIGNDWVHTSEAVLLPQGGRLVWARM